MAELGQILPVHLKLDTGMSRLGTNWQQATEFVKFTQGLPYLKIASIYSHLATADDLATAQRLIEIGSTGSVDVDSLRIEIAVNDGPEHSLGILRTLQDGGVAITGYRLRQPTLDEVFLALTGPSSVAETERIAS